MASKASVAERSQRALSSLSLLMNQVNEEYGLEPVIMPFWKKDAGLEQAMRLETVANWLDGFVQQIGLPGLTTGQVEVAVEEVDTPLLPIPPLDNTGGVVPPPDPDGLVQEVIEVEQSIDEGDIPPIPPDLPTLEEIPPLMSEPTPPDPEGTIPPPIIEPTAIPQVNKRKVQTPPKGK